MLADNVHVLEIVPKKKNIWPRSEASRVNCVNFLDNFSAKVIISRHTSKVGSRTRLLYVG